MLVTQQLAAARADPMSESLRPQGAPRQPVFSSGDSCPRRESSLYVEVPWAERLEGCSHIGCRSESRISVEMSCRARVFSAHACLRVERRRFSLLVCEAVFVVGCSTLGMLHSLDWNVGGCHLFSRQSPIVIHFSILVAFSWISLSFIFESFYIWGFNVG